MPKVSIIVPVYNKAEFLERGIQSLLDQTLDDIEVILVNDGSTDQSLEILTRFQGADGRVLVINQPNGGVSRARNAGLRLARGTYIGFMDPDDWVEEDMYRSMLELARSTESMICFCNFYLEGDGKRSPILLEGLPRTLDREEILSLLILNMLSADPRRLYKKEVMGSVFRLLIKKEYLDQQALCFTPDLVYMEDLVFTLGLLASVNQVAIDQGIHYHYQVQKGSASKKYIPHLFKLLLKVTDLLKDVLDEAGLYDKAQTRLEERMLFNAIRAVLNETQDDNPAPRDKRISEINKIIIRPDLLKVIVRFDRSNLPETRKQAITLIQEGNPEALYDYFSERQDALNPMASR